jgi:hypothetical protein
MCCSGEACPPLACTPRRLVERLAVFAGGWTLEPAEADADA